MMNQTTVTEFILLGLSVQPHLKYLFFALFLVIFLMTIVGNSLIIMAVSSDVHLQTPMYFFIVNLSFLEMCYTSVTIPNILVSLVMERKEISFSGCMTQIFFFTGFATTEVLMLASMACDRYAAICVPLRYVTIINRTVCLHLAVCAWLCGLINGTVNTVFTARLPLCGPNKIDRLYCEVQPLLKLSCSDTSVNDALATTSAAVFGIGCLVLIMISYFFIISAILRMTSRDGRHRAFSTCASHMTVVILYFGTLIFMYLMPSTESTEKVNSVVSLMYSVVTPVLNPIIYSLRNHVVKAAMRKVLLGGITGLSQFGVSKEGNS